MILRNSARHAKSDPRWSGMMLLARPPLLASLGRLVSYKSAGWQRTFGSPFNVLCTLYYCVLLVGIGVSLYTPTPFMSMCDELILRAAPPSLEFIIIEENTYLLKFSTKKSTHKSFFSNVSNVPHYFSHWVPRRRHSPRAPPLRRQSPRPGPRS